MLGQLLQEGDTFVDVGANYGGMCIGASRLIGPKGRIMAFEPNPLVHRFLARTLNGLPSTTASFEYACSDEEGRAQFFVPRTSSGAAGFVAAYSNQDDARSFSVASKTLDSALRDDARLDSISLIKIDVEGFEMRVLRGAMQTIRRHKPRLLIEINPEAMSLAGTHPEVLRKFLKSVGYREYSDGPTLPDRRPLSSLDVSSHRDIVVW